MEGHAYVPGAAENPAGTTYGIVNEDGTFSALLRVCSLTGTGTAVRKSEGNPVKQADLTSIICDVFDLGTDQFALTGTPVSTQLSLTISAVIFDTLQKLGWPDKNDPAGYNFKHTPAVTYVPTGGNWYLFRYKFTQTDNTVIWHRYKVKALARGGD